MHFTEFFNNKDIKINRNYRFITSKVAALMLAGSVFMGSAFVSGCSRATIALNDKTFVLEQGKSISADVNVYAKGTSEELGKCIVDISKVDSNTVGTYKAMIVHPKKILEFEVKVVDTTAPVVELYSDEINTVVGEKVDLYDILKSVSDNASITVGFVDDITKADTDKQLSDSISFEEAGEYNTEICARDSYGNAAVVPVVICVSKDAVAPILSGVRENIYTTVGVEADILADVTAEDDTDGDLTSKITVDTSAIDYNTPGEYQVTISVMDSSKNETSAAVSVIVKDENDPQNNRVPVEISSDFSIYSSEYVPFGVGTAVEPDTNRPAGLQWYIDRYGQYDVDFIQPDNKYIYLTYDLGYENGYTEQILDTLKEKNVKAVFFVLLSYVKRNPDIISRMIEEGHIIGNHTANHPANGLNSLPVDEQIKEVETFSDYLRDNYGYEVELFRFPSGSFSEQSIAVVQSLGYHIVFWSYAYRDWVVDDQPDVTESLNTAVNRVHGGAIYMFHGESATSTAMLSDFIDGCRAKGYEFGNYGDVH